MHVTAILLAAGKGLRLKTKVSKPLVEINSKPAIIYSLDTLSKHPLIKEIILVANSDNLKEILNKIRRYRINNIKDVVLGGRLRQDSVIKGLNAVDERADLVLIHDSARPFIEERLVTSVIKTARKYQAAIAGVPVKATIKRVASSQKSVVRGKFIEKTLDRKNLWEIQTPQVFKRELILEAYKKFGNSEVTDDASLVEKLGHRVRVVMGSYNNIKITTAEDLILAEAIAETL